MSKAKVVHSAAAILCVCLVTNSDVYGAFQQILYKPPGQSHLWMGSDLFVEQALSELLASPFQALNGSAFRIRFQFFEPGWIRRKSSRRTVIKWTAGAAFIGGLASYFGLFTNSESLPARGGSRNVPLGAFQTVISELDVLLQTPNGNMSSALKELRQLKRWRQASFDDKAAEDAAFVFRFMQATVDQRSREVHWDLATATADQRARLIRRQTLANMWSLAILETKEVAEQEHFVLNHLLPLIFDEQLDIANWLNDLRVRQLKIGEPLSAAPTGFFIAAPSLNIPSLEAFIQSLSSPMKDLSHPVQSLLSGFLNAYGAVNKQPDGSWTKVQMFDASPYNEMNRVLAPLGYAFHYLLKSRPSGVDSVTTLFYQLEEPASVRTGNDVWQGYLAEQLWRIGPSDTANMAIGGFEIGGTEDKAAIVDSVLISHAKNILAILQELGNQRPRDMNLSFWHPALKGLAKRAFPKANFNTLLTKIRARSFLHEFLHRSFRRHNTLLPGSNLFSFFQSYPTVSNPSLSVQEYAANVGTVALAESAPWELVWWVDMLSPKSIENPSEDQLLYSRLIRDLAQELSSHRPKNFESVANGPAFLTQEQGVLFLEAVSHVSTREIQTAAKRIYERNFGELMRAPSALLETARPARAAMFNFIRPIVRKRISHPSRHHQSQSPLGGAA